MDGPMNGPTDQMDEPYRLDDASNAAANAAEEARCLAAVGELLDADPDVVVGWMAQVELELVLTHDLKGSDPRLERLLVSNWLKF